MEHGGSNMSLQSEVSNRSMGTSKPGVEKMRGSQWSPAMALGYGDVGFGGFLTKEKVHRVKTPGKRMTITNNLGAGGFQQRVLAIESRLSNSVGKSMTSRFMDVLKVSYARTMDALYLGKKPCFDPTNAIMQGHAGKVYGLSWAGNSEDFVSVSFDGRMLMWNNTDLKKEPRLNINLRTPWAMSCAFEPSRCRLLAAGGLDNVCSIYRLPERFDHSGMATAHGMRVHKELMGHERYVSSCRFIDETQLLTSSGDHTCGLWDVESGVRVRTLLGHTDDVMSVSVLPNNSKHIFASGGCDGVLRIWDVRCQNGGGDDAGVATIGAAAARGKKANHRRNADINQVKLFMGGTALVSAAEDGCIRVFDLRAGTGPGSGSGPASGTRQSLQQFFNQSDDTNSMKSYGSDSPSTSPAQASPSSSVTPSPPPEANSIGLGSAQVRPSELVGKTAKVMPDIAGALLDGAHDFMDAATHALRGSGCGEDEDDDRDDPIAEGEKADQDTENGFTDGDDSVSNTSSENVSPKAGRKSSVMSYKELSPLQRSMQQRRLSSARRMSIGRPVGGGAQVVMDNKSRRKHRAAVMDTLDGIPDNSRAPIDRCEFKTFLSATIDKPALSVGVSRSGRIVYGGYGDGCIRAWDNFSNMNHDLALAQYTKVHVDRITSLEVSPDGKYIVTGSWDKNIRLHIIPEKLY